MSHQYERGDSLLRKLSDLVLGQWEDIINNISAWRYYLSYIYIYKKITTITNKNNEYTVRYPEIFGGDWFQWVLWGGGGGGWGEAGAVIKIYPTQPVIKLNLSSIQSKF